MNNSNPTLPQKNTFSFDFLSNETKLQKITFNSNFDSGNCSSVQQLTPTKYNIHTANDCAGLENEGYSKSWFYFSVSGFPSGTLLELNIWRINMLYNLRKYQDVYKPVYRIEKENLWRRIDKAAQLTIIEEKLVVSFEFLFEHLTPLDKVFFAFSYPFSYEESQTYINLLQKQFLFDSEIYFHREIIIKSPENRNIDLITITSHEGKQNEREPHIKESLFPNKKNEKRSYRFRDNKPVILLTARVHPGETPASHAMNGIIKFLLDKNDARAYLLRKYFVFMLIPMINPDGVYNGYYRMDIFNQNLNRYYKNPKITKQPAIFAIRNLVDHLKVSRRLIFYCDLHAHSARKGCFLFGNAINDFVSQIENQLYAKLVSLNCVNFEYNQCVFSKKHMRAKDRFEKLTKEGCGRVVVHKLCSIVHSYTLECGFHLSVRKNNLNDITNENVIVNGKYGFVNDSLENLDNSFYQNSKCYFDIAVYENVGKSLLISFLDVFEKNPYSRIENTKYKQIPQIRKEIGIALITLDRFKKNPQNFKKLRNLNELAFESFFQQFKSKKVFEVSDNSTVFNKSNKLKNLNSEEKKFLAKSSSFKEKEKRTSKNISKTPDKKKINFQSKFENFKSETNLFDDEKNEVWQREKEKEEDDLINELKEEYEEGGESELSYDSEEMDDEDMISYVQKNEKKEEEKKMILRERNLSQKKNIYLIEGYKNEIVQKSPESGKLEKFAKTNNVKTNDFDLIIRSNNSYQPYTPFIKEKKKNSVKINLFNIKSKNLNTHIRTSLSLKTERNGIGIFGKNQWKLPDININNLNILRQKQIEHEKLVLSKKIKV